MSCFIFLVATREGVIRITSRDIAARGIILIGNRIMDLLSILRPMTWIGALGKSVNCFVFFLEGFQIPLPLIFGLLGLVNSSIPVSQSSSWALLDELLVLPASKSFSWAVQFILVIRNSRILAHYAVVQRTFVVGDLLTMMLMGH